MIWALAIIAAFMIVIERIWPGRKLPSSHLWWLRIIMVNSVQLGIVILAGLTWDRWLSSASLIRLGDFMHPWAAALLAYFISTFIYYFWHRIRHESSFFWKLCHQLHHSPQRIEILTSFYKHPVEIFINSLLSALIVYTLLGLSIESAAIYTALTAVAEYFYHWNIRTPRWLGWLIQRPESHRLHHKFRHHSQNYADLPLWDWIFGTLDNPRKAPSRCGFEAHRELRIPEMLAFKDVHQAASNPTCFGCRKRWACQSSQLPESSEPVPQ